MDTRWKDLNIFKIHCLWTQWEEALRKGWGNKYPEYSTSQLEGLCFLNPSSSSWLCAPSPATDHMIVRTWAEVWSREHKIESSWGHHTDLYSEAARQMNLPSNIVLPLASSCTMMLTHVADFNVSSICSVSSKSAGYWVESLLIAVCSLRTRISF